MHRGVVAGLAAVLLLGVTACGREPRRGDPDPRPSEGALTAEYSLTVDGRERHYRVHSPGGATGKPVVIFLHGGGGTGELFARVSKMDTVADEGGFVVVYPDGNGRLGDKLLTWNAGDCCAYAKDQNIDDVAFVESLIDDVTQRFKTGDVFVTGFSNGAMMTYRLGCELADRIAAIAVVSGAMNLDTCAPSRQLPVLIMHGTADTAVPYDGGPSSAEFPTAGTWTNRSVQYAVDFWTKHNACRATPENTDAEETDGEVTRKSYQCAEPVTLYTIDGGGHGWPGGVKARPNAVEPTPPRPDASRVIWEFFKEQS
jgi:polyhydroxybutyrate depolymerase